MDGAADDAPHPAGPGLLALRRRLHRCIGLASLLLLVYASLCRQLALPGRTMVALDAPAAEAPLSPATAVNHVAHIIQPRPPALTLVTTSQHFPSEVLPDAGSTFSRAPPTAQPLSLSFASLALLSGVFLAVLLLVQSWPGSIVSTPLNDLLLDLLDEDSFHGQWMDDLMGTTAIDTLVPTDRAPIQVLTDVDDTIKSSGGVTIRGIALGGVDSQYPRGESYPGVFRFMLELAAHGCPAPQCPLPVAVLTARAREFLFALELDDEHPICRSFSETGQANGYDEWGIGDVLYGSVAEWVMQDRKGWRKFRNFRRLVARSRSERRYIFIGDTGERDQEAGEAMLDQFSRLMAAVFLHVVVPGPSLEPPPMPPDRRINGRPLLFFRTYAGAALKAAQHGLMGPEGLRAVMAQACHDLEAFEPRSSGSSRWAELEADLARCEAYLQCQSLLRDLDRAPGTSPR